MPICFPRGVSEEQECTVICNGGGSYTFIVPEGTFIAASLAEANAIAESYACNHAFSQRLCLGSLTFNALCVGDEFDETVEIDGEDRNLLYEIVSGALPSGLELVGLAMSFQIIGIPDTAGHYTFTVRATDESGGYADKEYSVIVLGIEDSSLPDFQVDVPYAYTFTATGGNGNYLWTLVSGSLPDGLSLSPGGTISGTPTLAAVGEEFVISVVDLDFQDAAATGCRRTFGLFPEGGRITEEEEIRLTEEGEQRITEDQ